MTENGKLWRRITEVPAEEVPAGGKYAELFRELLLRLEQTPPKYSLVVEMVDERAARAAASSLRPLFAKRLGSNAVFTSWTGTFLFVRRGPNWNHTSGGKARP